VDGCLWTTGKSSKAGGGSEGVLPPAQAEACICRVGEMPQLVRNRAALCTPLRHLTAAAAASGCSSRFSMFFNLTTLVLSIFRSSCECACLSQCSASVLCILRETLARNAVNFRVFGLLPIEQVWPPRRRIRTADLNRGRSAPCFCHGYARLINAGEGSPGSGVCVSRMKSAVTLKSKSQKVKKQGLLVYLILIYVYKP
jgi:hypothetical protein